MSAAGDRSHQQHDQRDDQRDEEARAASTARAISPDSGVAWTEPGAWPAAPGVHRIPLPLPMDGLKAVNVYAIEEPDGLTLIDAGWAIEVSRKLLESSLADAGYRVSDIRRFLVTHVHRDHYTQAVAVRREFGSQVSLGVGDRPTLELMHDPDLDENPQLESLRRAGARDIAETWARLMDSETFDLTDWAFPDVWLTGGEEIEVGDRRLAAVSTPGHTQGHVVFADQGAGVLFAGDHVLPTITPSIGVEPIVRDQALGDFLRSLAIVRALPDLRLLPAHGPIAPSVHARVDELLVHHDHRLQLCLDALAGGALSPYDVARQLPWTRYDRAFGALNFFDAALATLETRAHLELLVSRGVVRRGVEELRGVDRIETYELCASGAVEPQP